DGTRRPGAFTGGGLVDLPDQVPEFAGVEPGPLRCAVAQSRCAQCPSSALWPSLARSVPGCSAPPVPPSAPARARPRPGRHSVTKQAIATSAAPSWTTAMGTALSSPAIPTSGEAIAPMRKEDVPSSAEDRKSTRLNSSHVKISYAVFCLKKKKNKITENQRIEKQQNIVYAFGIIENNETSANYRSSDIVDDAF